MFQFNFDNLNSCQEFLEICNKYPECKNCPLSTQDIQLQSGMTRCETGRRRDNESK